MLKLLLDPLADVRYACMASPVFHAGTIIAEIVAVIVVGLMIYSAVNKRALKLYCALCGILPFCFFTLAGMELTAILTGAFCQDGGAFTASAILFQELTQVKECYSVINGEKLLHELKESEAFEWRELLINDERIKARCTAYEQERVLSAVIWTFRKKWKAEKKCRTLKEKEEGNTFWVVKHRKNGFGLEDLEVAAREVRKGDVDPTFSVFNGVLKLAVGRKWYISFGKVIDLGKVLCEMDGFLVEM